MHTGGDQVQDLKRSKNNETIALPWAVSPQVRVHDCTCSIGFSQVLPAIQALEAEPNLSWGPSCPFQGRN